MSINHSYVLLVAKLYVSNYDATGPTSLVDTIKQQEDMTDKYIFQLKALAPDSGVYLNEVRMLCE